MWRDPNFRTMLHADYWKKWIGYCALRHPCRVFFITGQIIIFLQMLGDLVDTNQWSCFTMIFPQRWAAQTPYTSSWVIINSCRLFSKISHYNKFDSTKSLGYITDVSKCHNVDVWSMDQNIIRFMLKNVFGNVLLSAASSRQAARNASIYETDLFQWIEMKYIFVLVQIS